MFGPGKFVQTSKEQLEAGVLKQIVHILLLIPVNITFFKADWISKD